MGNPLTDTGRNKSSSTVGDYFLLGVTRILGNASLFVFLIFLFNGSLNIVNLDWGDSARLLLDAFLSAAFFLQHSGMVRRSFKQWAAQFIEEKRHGALFTITSGILLLLVMALWQKSDFMLASAQDGARWALRAVFLLSLIGFFWGVRSLGSLDMFGLDPIRKGMQGVAAAAPRFKVRGPYRWARHPLYLFCLLMIWSCPDLTADRILFNLLWTVWIVIGAMLEERDLVAQFGAEYQSYQMAVPMLIPSGLRPPQQAPDGRDW